MLKRAAGAQACCWRCFDAKRPRCKRDHPCLVGTMPHVCPRHTPHLQKEASVFVASPPPGTPSPVLHPDLGTWFCDSLVFGVFASKRRLVTRRPALMFVVVVMMVVFDDDVGGVGW